MIPNLPTFRKIHKSEPRTLHHHLSNHEHLGQIMITFPENHTFLPKTMITFEEKRPFSPLNPAKPQQNQQFRRPATAKTAKSPANAAGFLKSKPIPYSVNALLRSNRVVLPVFLSSCVYSLRRGKWLLAAALLAAAAVPARALAPDEIVILYNGRSPKSLEVARHYATARKIPINHLLGITCDPGEIITEELYRTSIVPQVRKQFESGKFTPALAGGAGTIKCIVTTYDLPLRIEARKNSPIELQEILADERQRDNILNELEKSIAAYDAIAAANPLATTSPATAPGPRNWQTISARINVAASAAATRLEKTSEPARSRAMADFIHAQERVAGIRGLLNSLQVSPNAPDDDPGRKQLAELQSRLRDVEQQYAALAGQLDQPRARAQVVNLRQQAEGLVGAARAIEDLLTLLKPDGTEACFDSELSLVFADNYPRGNWVQNPVNLEMFPAVQRARQAAAAVGAKPVGVPPTILVSRLDGESPAKIEAMIDSTLKVEAAGLEGKLYLDARGLHGTDGYAIFDADIRRAADWLKQHSTIDVVLDDTDKLFVAKDAPDAALYCGWYSLHNYQDSCQWVPGAVGYHVASYEMPTLHNPKDPGWVPQLLARGFCGTLGATDEPFLNAFPKPSLFFPLLLSGEFTQGEVWQVTEPLLSWRIGYVGDPLYNPYKVKPRVKVEDLRANPVLQNAFTILRGTR